MNLWRLLVVVMLGYAMRVATWTGGSPTRGCSAPLLLLVFLLVMVVGACMDGRASIMALRRRIL